MIALLRYTMAVLLHSQRYLPPLMLFVGVSVMFIGSSDTGPVVPIYAPVTGMLFVCATWLAVMLVNAEDPVRRAVTVVNAGRSLSVLVATVVVALAVCLLVAGVVLFLPVVLGQHTVTAAGVIAGFLAQLAAASTGVAIGLLGSRLVISRAGYALLVALALVAIFALTKGLPPVNPMIRLLASDAPDPLATTVYYAVVGVVLLAASTAFTQFMTTRRD